MEWRHFHLIPKEWRNWILSYRLLFSHQHTFHAILTSICEMHQWVPWGILQMEVTLMPYVFCGNPWKSGTIQKQFIILENILSTIYFSCKRGWKHAHEKEQETSVWKQMIRQVYSNSVRVIWFSHIIRSNLGKRDWPVRQNLNMWLWFTQEKLCI